MSTTQFSVQPQLTTKQKGTNEKGNSEGSTNDNSGDHLAGAGTPAADSAGHQAETQCATPGGGKRDPRAMNSLTANTDQVIPNDLAVRMRSAEDDILGANWTDHVLRKIEKDAPEDSELGRALKLVLERVKQFNAQSDTEWRKTRQEIDALHQQKRKTYIDALTGKAIHN